MEALWLVSIPKKTAHNIISDIIRWRPKQKCLSSLFCFSLLSKWPKAAPLPSLLLPRHHQVTNVYHILSFGVFWLLKKWKWPFSHILRPLRTNILPMSGENVPRNHFWPLVSGFLTKKSEEKGLISQSPQLLILRLVIPEPQKYCQNFLFSIFHPRETWNWQTTVKVPLYSQFKSFIGIPRQFHCKDKLKKQPNISFSYSGPILAW